MLQSMLVISVLFLYAAYVVTAQNNLFCHYLSSAIHRPGIGKFGVENIDPNLCTHLVYSNLELNEDGSVKVRDLLADIHLDGFNKFNKLKLKNGNLKTLIAIGGTKEDSVKFSAVAATEQTRQRFIAAVNEFMNSYDFDGVSIDWMHPDPSDKDNFVYLLEELKAALGSDKLLSVAVGVSNNYKVPQISAVVHYVNLRTMNLETGKLEISVASPLLFLGPNDRFAITKIVSDWLLSGPSSKLVLGIPISGRTFTLKNPTQTYVGAPAVGPGLAGPLTGIPGFLGYNEVVRLDDQWTRVWDDDLKVPYMFKEDKWISYENERSINEKVAFIKNLSLSGVMVWSIDIDIPTVVNGKRPLIPLIKEGLA